MIKFENTEVVGWEAAIRGMRNPMNSWEKSDSHPAVDCGKCGIIDRDGFCDPKINRPIGGCGKEFECFVIGPNDLDLMKRLRNAGTDHRKFMRMLTVYVDITAPLYWWKEFDTYKVGTVANSCSTMHKIADKEFTLEDFSCEHLMGGFTSVLNELIDMLNYARDKFIETKDKKYWWQMIQLLPSSYNQRRTVMLNYEVLANIYKSRKDHKLDEWKEHTEDQGIRLYSDDSVVETWQVGLCDWIKTLPYSELITGKFEED